MTIIKPITIIRYENLEECFCKCMHWDELPSEEELKYSYWLGHDGSRPYRINVWKWLNNTKKKAWGFANYKSKTIHIWIHPECSMEEAIQCIAHEASHLRRPKYKNSKDEEKKAEKVGLDARFAYEAAIGFLRKE